MPNRILKESICTSDNLDTLTAFQETFFYRLIVNCDDYGRFDARPKILAAKLFPLKEIKPNQTEEALCALASAELITLYEVDGKPYLQMNGWNKHQVIRSKKSKYPDPEAGEIICKQMQADDSECLRNPIQSESESNPNRNPMRVTHTPRERAHTQTKFQPPTVEEVKAYCSERGNNIDANRFVDFYASKGWKVGNQPMKDWKACVRTWEQHDKSGYVGNGTNAKPNPALQYGQRQYTAEDDDEFMKRINSDLLRDAGQQ